MRITLIWLLCAMMSTAGESRYETYLKKVRGDFYKNSTGGSYSGSTAAERLVKEFRESNKAYATRKVVAVPRTKPFGYVTSSSSRCGLRLVRSSSGQSSTSSKLKPYTGPRTKKYVPCKQRPARNRYAK